MTAQAPRANPPRVVRGVFVWALRFFHCFAGFRPASRDRFMATAPTTSPFTFSTLDAWLAHLEAAHPVGIDMGLTGSAR